MSNASEIADTVQSENGWTDATLLGVVLDYVENQEADDAFEDYLRERAGYGVEVQNLMFALTTPQGTAMPETGICRDDYLNHARRESARAQADGEHDNRDFQDVSGNPEISCVFCGKVVEDGKLVTNA